MGVFHTWLKTQRYENLTIILTWRENSIIIKTGELLQFYLKAVKS